ncbi:MAG: 23S rRNA (adenine(2030)-N(6))-methyltransferase RlmJ [Gammaproteobacteria bacterium]|jgi:23S rRNA (adenine2030-N6)-methyltransferase
MLNYRHSNHAGNFADVVKHVILVALLQTVTRKTIPCYFHDSHAGRGIYDLDTADACRDREFESGIGRLWQQMHAPPAVMQYLEIVRQCNRGLPALRYYPGSPVIAQAMLRVQDRLLLTELQPREHNELIRQFRADTRFQIHAYDAYAGLEAFLPPPEKRGLVLIDPAYEDKAEYEQVLSGLIAAHARWREGMYAIWYPLVSRELQARFLKDCIASGIRKQLHVEFRIASFASPCQFVGCGLVLVNPPWRLETTIDTCLQWLRAPLQQAEQAVVRVDWLVSE